MTFKNTITEETELYERTQIKICQSYNVTNTGYITTDKLVDKLKNTIAKDKEFTLITEKELYNGLATARRSNCVMDNSKLLSTGIKIQSYKLNHTNSHTKTCRIKFKFIFII